VAKRFSLLLLCTYYVHTLIIIIIILLLLLLLLLESSNPKIKKKQPKQVRSSSPYIYSGATIIINFLLLKVRKEKGKKNEGRRYLPNFQRIKFFWRKGILCHKSPICLFFYILFIYLFIMIIIWEWCCCMVW
jgi:hypothetical protein